MLGEGVAAGSGSLRSAVTTTSTAVFTSPAHIAGGKVPIAPKKSGMRKLGPQMASRKKHDLQICCTYETKALGGPPMS